jgi:hypothetical protein
MSYFAVIREAGPAWADGGITEQPAIHDHAAFMSAMADQGFVLFAERVRRRGATVGRVRVGRHGRIATIWESHLRR